MTCHPRYHIVASAKKTFQLVTAISLSLLPSRLFSMDLPLLYDGCSVRVAAEVERRPAYLIFDTGCTISALDKMKYPSQLGEPVANGRASSVGGLMNMPLFIFRRKLYLVVRSNILTGSPASIFLELLRLAVRNAMESWVLILRSVT